jgi:heterodisulfide reductase subunit A
MTAVKNAILLKEADPATAVTILYRDMQMYGVENEDLFRRSKELGVRYVTYDVSRPPIVEDGRVKVHHLRMGKDLAMPADLVVLSTPLIAQEDAGDISSMLKVPLNNNGFFLEGHVKLKRWITHGRDLPVQQCPFSATIRRRSPRAWRRVEPSCCRRKRFTSGIVATSTRRPAVAPWRGRVRSADQLLCRSGIGEQGPQVVWLCRSLPSGSARLDRFSNDQIYAQIDKP